MKLKLSIMLFITTTCFAFDYKQWWENWYAHGGISGPGSRGILAQFKADTINNFIKEHAIHKTIEFGCGDGINLAMIQYAEYIGLDVSKTILQHCQNMFKDDSSKQFFLYTPGTFNVNRFENVDLVVCLDVLYHITDEEEFVQLLDDIFSCKSPYVILYTTLYKHGNSPSSPEILHRNILPYLEKYSEYDIRIEKQKYPKIAHACFIFLTKK